MQYNFVKEIRKRTSADLLVLPFCHNKSKKIVPVFNLKKHIGEIRISPKPDIFFANEGESLCLSSNKQKEKYFLLLGLGEEKSLTTKILTRVFAEMTKLCLTKHLERVNVIFPEVKSLEETSVLKSICEGIALTNYIYDTVQKGSIHEINESLLKKITLIGLPKAHHAIAKKALSIPVHLAGDIVNEKTDVMTAKYLASIANDLQKELSNIEMFDSSKRVIDQEGIGILIPVNKNSQLGPAYIALYDKGDPQSESGLEHQRHNRSCSEPSDMDEILPLFDSQFSSKNYHLKTTKKGIIVSVESCMLALSHQSGYVLENINPKAGDVLNADPEGSLMLADIKLKSMNMIDIATMTEGVVVALGSSIMGLMSNEGEIAATLVKATEEGGEDIWCLPLYNDCRFHLHSELADVKPVSGRTHYADAVVAGLFLQEFVDGIPWTHLDIAKTALLAPLNKRSSSGTTGVEPSLMIAFLEDLMDSES